MTRIGTLTITGSYPLQWDGLDMGEAECVRVYASTLDGFVRRGRLFKTLDPAALMEALGVRGDYSLKTWPPARWREYQA